jgi:predicted SprT family Zn-dependent metalloprotease
MVVESDLTNRLARSLKMELHKAQEWAELLIARHGAEGYTFKWMERRKRFNRAGQCNWKKKTIELQPCYAEQFSDEDVLNTILHEIAHALRPRHGHNKFWRKTAVSIGCNGKRCYTRKATPSQT